MDQIASELIVYLRFRLRPRVFYSCVWQLEGDFLVIYEQGGEGTNEVTAFNLRRVREFSATEVRPTEPPSGNYA